MSGHPPGLLARALRRDRWIVVAGLVLVTGLAWLHLFHLAGAPAPGRVAAPGLERWSVFELLLLFVMWAVMMVAMMLPTAAPMILLHRTVARRRRERGGAPVSTAVFGAGYLLVWIGYAAAATLTQWGLHEAALLSPMGRSTSHALAGALLIGAGLFQWTPLKEACLTACRSPLGWLTAEWREGTGGALLMGLRHGSYCVGCCWALMALLFVAGVMNLAWVAVLAAFALVEKVAPAGEWVGRAAGLGLVAWGAWLMVGASA